MSITPILAAAVAFSLEWNPTYRTDVPYETELFPDRVGAKSFRVLADGKELDTQMYSGKAPGSIGLRFRVPAGTKGLVCKGGDEAPALADTSRIDNLFADALAAANRGKWQLPKGVKVEPFGNGIMFRADATAPANAYVSYDVDIPETLAGMPVWQEIDVMSHSHLVWGGQTSIVQLDADGKALPETLCDRRWTTHMRPPEKPCRYRDEGHIHPKARKLRFVAELRRVQSEYDEYGLPVKDRSILLPSLSLTHLAVRVAERLPFPKWNDGFFGEGVSGKPGDCSFRMGGANGRSMFYQLRSRAAWTQHHQFRREEDILFPSGAGTVEAWLKPDWKAFVAARKAEKPASKAPATIFEAYQAYIAAQCKKGMGPMLRLDYRPQAQDLSLLMRDHRGTLYTNTFAGVLIPDGRWTHLAMQWTPCGSAQVFVDGKRVAEMPIPDFQAAPIADKSVGNPNDSWAMEFFFGGGYSSARDVKGIPKGPGGVFFEGEGDCLRISTGCRYKDGFEPAKAFACDADTRALFTFDRWFDGVSGGGFGFIPASVRALDDRVDHVLRLEGGKILQYYPAAILPENDPLTVLDHDNYPVLPSDAEYREARVSKVRTFSVKPGGKVRFTAADRAYPDFVEYENASETEPLRYPILVRKGCLDPRSFGDLSDSLLDADKTDRERVNRLFQYVMHASDYYANYQACFTPGRDVPHMACYEAMIMLNSYCGFECGPLNNMTANMFATVAKCPSGQTAGYGHEFEQVFYDGKNHIYDLSARKFFPAMDNETSAYLKEVGDQPIINRRVDGNVDHFMRRGTRGSWVQNPSYGEKFGAVLNPGERLRVWYANNAQMNNVHTKSKSGVYGLKKLGPDACDYADVLGSDQTKCWTMRSDRIFPHYSTSVISFDGVPTRKNPAFGNFTDGSFTYHVRSPYPIVWTEYAAHLKSGKAAPLAVSTDFGKTYHALPSGKDGNTALEYRLKARHDFLIRVDAPIGSVTRFVARTEGEVNPRTYPGWVKGGENEFTFKAEPGGKATVRVGWREPAKEIVVSGVADAGAIPGFERSLVVVDPSEPLKLAVTGASAAATARTYGRLRASISNGALTLSYDGTKPPAIKHGIDRPVGQREFPAFACVDIVDGDAVKSVTAVISPNARLLLPDDQKMGWSKEFHFKKLPAGKYQVFVLGRCASRPSACRIGIQDPMDGKKSISVWRHINEIIDYRGMVFFGRDGGRSRWKWDTIMRPDLPRSSGGHIFGAVEFPETDTLKFVQSWLSKEPLEFGAALVVPEADDESLLEFRKMLFGLNCDPFHIK